MDNIKIVYDIEEAAKMLSNGENIAFGINDKNKSSFFSFFYYQIKHKTNKEFKIIYYETEKDALYFMISLVAKMSFGRYKLIHVEDLNPPYRK